MKSFLKSIIPESMWNIMRKFKQILIKVMGKGFGFIMKLILKAAHFLGFKSYIWNILKDSKTLGLNVYPLDDFYSPMPVLDDLKKNISRWSKPSQLVGVHVDIEAMKSLLMKLSKGYSNEYRETSNYYELDSKRFGPGFTRLDAMLLYFMIRDTQPHHYIEIGSGLSTKFCSMAAEQNGKNGSPLKVTCIEPYPYEMLYSIPAIEIIKKEVQDVELAVFDQLNAGDILFIDSTHVVKIDGDVPYLFLEVLPRLKKGVRIHIHDISFPYNVPYPDRLYIFNRTWPWFFTEAMLLQAFLSFNDAFKIIASIPYLSTVDEQFLHDNISGYNSFSAYTPDTLDSLGYPPCSIWLEKVK